MELESWKWDAYITEEVKGESNASERGGHENDMGGWWFLKIAILGQNMLNDQYLFTAHSLTEMSDKGVDMAYM